MSYTEMHAYFYPVMFTPETPRSLQGLESLDPSKSQDVASGSPRPASWLPIAGSSSALLSARDCPGLLLAQGSTRLGLFSKDAAAGKPLGCTISMTTAGAVSIRRTRYRDAAAPRPAGCIPAPACLTPPCRPRAQPGPPTWRAPARGARALLPRRPRSRRAACPSPAAAAPPLGHQVADGGPLQVLVLQRRPAANPPSRQQPELRYRCRRRRRRSGGRAQPRPGPAPSPRMRAPRAPGWPPHPSGSAFQAVKPGGSVSRVGFCSQVPARPHSYPGLSLLQGVLELLDLIGRWHFRPYIYSVL